MSQSDKQANDLERRLDIAGRGQERYVAMQKDGGKTVIVRETAYSEFWAYQGYHFQYYLNEAETHALGK